MRVGKRNTSVIKILFIIYYLFEFSTIYRNISPAIIPATTMTKPSSAATRKRAIHPPKINKQGRLTGGKTTIRVAAGP